MVVLVTWQYLWNEYTTCYFEDYVTLYHLINMSQNSLETENLN